MEQKKAFLQKIRNLFFRYDYLVFRRYMQIPPDFKKYESVLDMPDSSTWEIKESFALHFVKPFKSKKEAQLAIDNAKYMQPWQEFIILRGC